MTFDQHDPNWGARDRSFFDRHPWAKKFLAGAVTLAAGAAAIRFGGPTALRSMESFFLREFSAPTGGRVGMLNRFAGALHVPINAHGQAVAPTTRLGRFLGWGAQQMAERGGFSNIQRQAYLSGGLHAIATQAGVDVGALSNQHVRSLGRLLLQHDALAGTAGWLEHEDFKPLQSLFAGHASQEEALLGAAKNWHTTGWAETVARNPALRTHESFTTWMRSQASGVTGQQGWFNTLLGGRPLTSSNATALKALDPTIGSFHEQFSELLAGGVALDPHILQLGGHTLDYRMTAHVFGQLGEQIARNFQIPIVPGVSSFRPLIRFAGEGGALRPFEMLQTGSLAPALTKNISGALTEGALVSNEGAWSVGADGRISQLLDSALRRESPRSYLSNALGRMMGTGETAAPRPGVLGWFADTLDLFRSEERSLPGEIIGRAQRSADPNWQGNLVRRIWSDGPEEALGQAEEKVKALKRAFSTVARVDFNTESPFFQQINKSLGELGIGDITTQEGLAGAHGTFARIASGTGVISPELRRLVQTPFDELIATGRMQDFQRGLAREGILRQVVGTSTSPQQAIMDALVGKTESPLAQFGLATELPGHEGSRAFVVDTLLKQLSLDSSALSGSPQELILQLRGSNLVKQHLEKGVWDKAYGLLSPLDAAPGTTPFVGQPFVPIPESRLSARALVRGGIANMMENLRAGLRELGLGPGRMNPQDITAGTLDTFSTLDNFNKRLNGVLGLGLSQASTGSIGQFAGGLLLKRALPLAAGSFYAGYLGWEFRRFIHGGDADDKGQAPGVFANLRAKIGLTVARFEEATGITALQKKLVDMVPGLDNYLKPQTYEERKQYYGSGYEAVRRGARGLFDGYMRPNLLGREPIYGGKITHWRPNWYARASADADFSDSTLTRDEYYKHSWLPTPRHPFSPLVRLFNPYHWEDKHQDDRPYPVSGDLFTATRTHESSIAALGNAALGWLLKPRRVRASVRQEAADASERMHARARQGAGGVGSLSLAGGAGQPAGYTDEAGLANEGAGLLQTTTRGTQSLYSARGRVMEQLAQHAEGIRSRAEINRYAPYTPYHRPRPEMLFSEDEQRAMNAPDVGGRLGDIASNVRRLMGVRGMGAQMAGEWLGLQESSAIQHEPAHHGYGGRRHPSTRYINQLRNTLPSWLPDDYMGEDFHEGDKMGRLRDGHMRLPGAGYEKLYRVKFGDHRKMTMDALGMGQDELSDHLLGLDIDTYEPRGPAGDRRARRKQIREQFDSQQMTSGTSVDIRLPWFWQDKRDNWHFGMRGPWVHLAGPKTPAALDIPLWNNWHLHLAGRKYPFRKYFTPANIFKRWGAVDLHLSALPGKPWMHLFGSKYPGRRYLNAASDVVDDWWRTKTAGDIKTGLKGKPWFHLFGRKAPRRHYWKWQNAMMPDGYFPGWDDAMKGLGAAAKGQVTDFLGLKIGKRAYVQKDDRGDTASDVNLYDPVHDIRGRVDLMLEEHERHGGWVFEHRHRSLIPTLIRDDDGNPVHKQQDEASALFAAYMTNAPYAYLSYANGDKTQRLEKVKYDKARMRAIFEKVNAARTSADERFNDPSISSGEKYSSLDRFRILADTAPYSDETEAYAKRLTRTLDPDSEKWEEFQAIKERMSQQKKQYQLHPYRFRRAGEVRKERVTIDKILDPNTFTTTDDPLHPIRLAGVRLAKSRIDGDWIDALSSIGIAPGKHVTILRDPNTALDQMETYHAAVFANGKNVNREALKRGWAREDKHKSSPAELFVYYGAAGRAFGRIAEYLAHADTPLHTKFLKVRSPLEEYERGQLYGKTGGSMSHPWRDWVVPTAESIVHHNPLYAGMLGAAAVGLLWRGEKTNLLRGGIKNILSGAIGNFFGGRTKMAIMGAAGLIGMAISGGIRLTHDANHPWIPGRRQKEWGLQEYADKLEYLKATRHYLHYRAKAQQEDGVDVDQLQADLKLGVRDRRAKLDALEQQRRELKLSMDKSHRASAETIAEQRAQLKQIQAEINNLEDQSSLLHMTPNAAKALLYKRAADHTMYGMPADAAIGDRLMALPTKHRQLISEAMQSSSMAERKRLARLLPEAEQRVIGRQLDPSLVKPRKADLVEYFRKHFLPREHWRGWEEDQNLTPVLAKEVQRMGLDPREFAGLYHDQMRAGVSHPLSTGPMSRPRTTDPAAVREELHRALAPYLDGLDVHVTTTHGQHHGGTVNIHLTHPRDEEMDDYLNHHHRAAL